MDKNYGYKHTKGFLAFIVIIIIMVLLAPAFSQNANVDTTGNLVNNTQTANTVTSTWQNAKFVNELTCWQAGDPNCSPGTPYVRPGGDINFSYGFTELYQVVNVSKALPNSGTGLVTTGFSFSWQSKNGNYWDDARQDELKAYVQGYTKSGKWIENFNYDLNFVHDWTNFTWNKNWSEIRRPNDLANVIFGFAGKDNNYWVGPYGPEITNVNFQLKYKPDPCVTNPLFSPECPKFTETLQKNSQTTYTTSQFTPPPTEDQVVNSYKQPKPYEGPIGEKEEGVYREEREFSEPLNVNIESLDFALTKIFDQQAKQEEQSLEIASDAIQKTEQQSKDVVRNAEQRVKDVVDQQFKELINIRQNSIEIKQNIFNVESVFKGPEQSSSVTSFQLPGNQHSSIVNVLQDNKALQSSQSREQVSVSVARPLQHLQHQNNNKQDSNIVQETNKEQTIREEVTLSKSNYSQVLPPAPIFNPAPIVNINPVLPISITQPTEITSPSIIVTTPQTEVLVQPVATMPRVESNNILTSPTNPPLITQPNIEIFQPSLTVQQVEIPVLSSNFLTNKADPINEIIDSKPKISTENKNEEKQQVVKANVPDNDAAAGVSISNIARTPIGFNSYMIALTDANFYSPKEIYRNQKTIDNARALRQLASDRLHQQMVDQQYLPR